MYRIFRLNQAQRVVLVVALGLGIGAVGSYLVSLESGFGSGLPNFGAFTAGGGFAPSGWHLAAWLRVIIWLALIGLWAIASVRLLRSSGHATPVDDGKADSSGAGAETRALR